MPLVLGLGSLLVSGIFGLSSLLRSSHEAENETERLLITAGGLALAGLGAYVLFLKKGKK